MRFARWVFAVAGLCGLAVIVPPYFMEERFGLEHPPAVNHPEFYYGFMGVTLAWQFLFLLIAYDPIRYRLAMLPAMVEKISFVAAVFSLYALHRVSGSIVGFAVLDAMWFVLFAISLLRTPHAREKMERI
jgi:hypothetical protein